MTLQASTHSTGTAGAVLFLAAVLLIGVAVVLIVRGPRGPRS